MFGTFSMFVTAAARSMASLCRSEKVPSGAYTSIMGMSWFLAALRMGRSRIRLDGGFSTPAIVVDRIT
jgi:hypothetical protein